MLFVGVFREYNKNVLSIPMRAIKQTSVFGQKLSLGFGLIDTMLHPGNDGNLVLVWYSWPRKKKENEKYSY